MVLQRGRPIPIWGWSEPGTNVTVEFAGQRKSAVADEKGKWFLKLDPLPASKRPRKLSVVGAQTLADPPHLALHDVLVGEVWIAGGQSNMDFTLSKKVKYFAGVANEEEEIAAANYPLLRMFTAATPRTYTPQERVDGEWRVCTPETAPAFSAIGYFFARDLLREINVPIGIITLALGASTAESWIRRETLLGDPWLKIYVEHLDGKVKEFVPLTPEEEQQWQAAAAKALAAGQRRPPRPRWDPTRDQHNATVLYNGMIAPMIPYAIRGVIWYQGESIQGGEKGRRFYPRMQATLIRDWRLLWNLGDFPFYIVQLAGQECPSNSPLVREVQATVLALNNTGMVVTTDGGTADNVHPRNQSEVGDRLARIALANVYGKKIEFSGPTYQTMKIEGNAIRLTFSHAGGGLVAKGGGPLNWFEIAGADEKFVAAEATIEGETIVVRSAEVAAPVAARYAWANFPQGANLFNAAGLPAAQFRTDAPKYVL